MAARNTDVLFALCAQKAWAAIQHACWFHLREEFTDAVRQEVTESLFEALMRPRLSRALGARKTLFAQIARDASPVLWVHLVDRLIETEQGFLPHIGEFKFEEFLDKPIVRFRPVDSLLDASWPTPITMQGEVDELAVGLAYRSFSYASGGDLSVISTTWAEIPERANAPLDEQDLVIGAGHALDVVGPVLLANIEQTADAQRFEPSFIHARAIGFAAELAISLTLGSMLQTRDVDIFGIGRFAHGGKTVRFVAAPQLLGLLMAQSTTRA